MMGLTDEMAQPVLDALAEGGPDRTLHAEELIEKIACQQILENDEILADSLDGLEQRFARETATNRTAIPSPPR